MRKQWRGQRIVGAVFLGIAISLSGVLTPSFLERTPSYPTAQNRFQWGQIAAAQSPLLPEQMVQQEAQGRELYRQGQFEAAIAQWQRIAQTYATQSNYLGQASALSNLSLSYQQVGQWAEAEAAVGKSVSLLNAATGSDRTRSSQLWPVLAQSLMTQGSLQIATGQPEAALESWQEADESYQKSSNATGRSRAQINQAQALRELGFYRQALEKLVAVSEDMAGQPDSQLKAIALHRLGEALRLSGQLEASQSALTQSLAMAKQFAEDAEVSAVLLSLGRTVQGQGNLVAAEELYEKAVEAVSREVVSAPLVSAELTQLALYIEMAQSSERDGEQADAGWDKVASLWPRIQAQFDELPQSRTAIYHQINWATSLLKVTQSASEVPSSVMPDMARIAGQLREAVLAARNLSDVRAEAHALGTLGKVYEQNQQWAQAQELTQQALSLSTAIRASDIAYQWQWQLGRLWVAAGNPQRSVEKSLTAYYQAVDTLFELRGDLAAANTGTQFSFKENVEPIYRQLVSLLLQTDEQAPDYQGNLASAQKVIESLRLAELDNYFQEACVDIDPIDITQVDKKAATIYTVVLEDRLSVILNLPDQPLRHFSTAIAADEVSEVTRKLRQQLVIRSRRSYGAAAQQVYEWLIAPVRTAIDESGVETLVFVLDGPLQNIPMATLYDGDRFLVEDYAIGLTPGLKLLNPRNWETNNLSALIAGLTENRLGLGALPYVAGEVENVSDYIRDTTVLLNKRFTQEALSSRLESTGYPIVHVATHGQFGSTPEDTYLLAWDKLINVRSVSQMLQANLGARAGIELLVLSACETASGDQQAALGLAGVAIKAGARSTMGTLWSINDEATSRFIGYFYEQLTQPGATRAGALRQAQIKLLQDPQYRHPIYWAPYVLIGSWL